MRDGVGVLDPINLVVHDERRHFVSRRLFGGIIADELEATEQRIAFWPHGDYVAPVGAGILLVIDGNGNLHPVLPHLVEHGEVVMDALGGDLRDLIGAGLLERADPLNLMPHIVTGLTG